MPDELPLSEDMVSLIEKRFNDPECPDDHDAVFMMKRLVATIRQRDNTIETLKKNLAECIELLQQIHDAM